MQLRQLRLLEQYTSATGIVRLAKRRLEEDDKPSALRNNPNISAKAVLMR